MDFSDCVTYGESMALLEDVITELRRLRPDQVEIVAQVIHDLSHTEGEGAPLHSGLPRRVVDEAVQNGWPAELFTELIGSLPSLERADQPSLENRSNL